MRTEEKRILFCTVVNKRDIQREVSGFYREVINTDKIPVSVSGIQREVIRKVLCVVCIEPVQPGNVGVIHDKSRLVAGFVEGTEGFIEC